MRVHDFMPPSRSRPSVDLPATSGRPWVEAELMDRTTGWLDRAFWVAVVGKGLNGLLELVGGVLLLLVSPDRIHQLAVALTQGELSEDPRDVVATHLLHTTAGLTAGATLFGAAYLLLHGLVKVVLVIALLRDKLWAYPWMIGVLAVFIGYQLYRIALSPTAGLVALTAFDLVIVVLTWREMRQRRRHRTGSSVAPQDLAVAGRQGSPVA
jgi:uncharacterized membrane protein